MVKESNVALREAVVLDVDDYLKLEKKVGGKTYAALVSKEEFLEEIGGGKIYLFELDGRTIGHITYQTREDDSVHLGGFAIEPKYQGKGFGRMAMELILRKAKNAPQIDLVTHPENLKAIKLYQSFGFKVGMRKENYFGDGEPRIILVKDRFSR